MNDNDDTSAPGTGDNTAACTVTGIPEAATADRAADARRSLPPGTRLADVEIVCTLAEDEVGVLYEARDLRDGRTCAVKEFIPARLGMRTASGRVQPRTPAERDAFEVGRRGFVSEARLLIRFEHPALLSVERCWVENDTAYLVLPRHEGPTLGQVLAARTEPLSEEALLALLAPLLDALEHLHAAHRFHRAIGAESVLLLGPAQPLLPPPRAARRALGLLAPPFDAATDPGSADIPQLAHGGWTDLQALAGLAHLAITGAPHCAVANELDQDHLSHLATTAGRYSTRLLSAIDRALSPHAPARPRDVRQWREWLGISAPSGARPAPQVEAVAVIHEACPASEDRAPRIHAAAPTQASLAAAAIHAGGTTSPPRAAPDASPSQRPARGAALAIIAGALAVGGLWLSAQREPQSWSARGAPSTAVDATRRSAAPDVWTTTAPRPGAGLGAQTPLSSTEGKSPSDNPDALPPTGSGPLAAPTRAIGQPSAHTGRTALAAPTAPALSPAAAAQAADQPAASGPARPPAASSKPSRSRQVAPIAAAPAARRPARCDDIVGRVSLGESITADERDFIRKECRS